MGRMKSLIGVVLALLLLVAGAGIAGAAPKMIIDRSHGQTADVSGFASVLVSRGWEVFGDQVTEVVPLTADTLNTCNLLVVTQPSTLDFSPDEIAAVEAYVQAGGGLWVLYDEYGPAFNALPQAFGVNFNNDLVWDLTSDGTQYTEEPPIVVPASLQSHPLFAGVTDFVYMAGTSLSSFPATDPATPPALPVVLTGSAAGYDDGFLFWSYPPVLAAGEVTRPDGTVGGRVLFIGDMTPLASTVYPTLGTANKNLLDNIVAWVMKPEPAPPEPPKTIEVKINIRPWNPHNTISLGERGFIRVAVMSDAKSKFDAATVVPKTVKFAGASPICWKLQNVNCDHQKDLVLVFWVPDLKDLSCDSTAAELTGNLKNGTAIHGSDSVQILPTGKCKPPKKCEPPKNDKCGGKKGK